MGWVYIIFEDSTNGVEYWKTVKHVLPTEEKARIKTEKLNVGVKGDNEISYHYEKFEIE